MGSTRRELRRPPLKNKRFDFWRRITIAVGEPFKVDREMLKDHHATRRFLLDRVVAQRAVLGLPPIEADEDDKAENGHG